MPRVSPVLFAKKKDNTKKRRYPGIHWPRRHRRGRRFL